MTQMEINNNSLRRLTRSMEAKMATNADIDENRRVTRSMNKRLREFWPIIMVKGGNNSKGKWSQQLCP